MLKSMTGYGRCERIDDGGKVLVEIKSVNHRYSDYTVKVPKYYGFLEDRVRKYMSGIITRGKTDVFIAIENYDDDVEISLNEEYAKKYINVLGQLKEKFNLDGEISLSEVTKNSEIFNVQRKETDEDAIWDMVEPVLAEAAEAFVKMRGREGERIQKDLEFRVEYMKKLTAQIEEKAPLTVTEYREKLYAKIREVLEDREVDEARILTEAAIFADKVAVDEELVRLKSHYEEFFNIVNSNEPAGRKLDFLIQEINREINTTGSKANNIEIAKKVVELKAETEKLREQVQNIE